VLPLRAGHKRRALARTLILAVATALAAPAAAQDVPEKVTFAVVPIEVAAVPYYANDLGYFKSAGIDATITPLQNGDAIVSAVASGAIDIGFSNALSLIVAHDKGLPLKILFGTELNAGAAPTNGILTVLKSAAIRSAKDLTGKTVAVSSLSSTNIYAVKNWIDKNGGDSKSVRYVEVPVPAMADTLSAGRVDAASMDAVNFNSRKDVLVALAPTYASVAPRFIGGGFIATSAWLDAHQQLARKIVANLRKAAIYANAHHDDAVKLYAAHSRFTLADLAAAPRPTYSTAATPALYQPLIDLAARYGLIKATFPAADVVSPLGE
jgi:NitT/TauT family transport system substrate-binding protein